MGFSNATCDWCHVENTRVVSHRDADEGFCGPEYMVCNDCIRKESERAEAELRGMDILDQMRIDEIGSDHQ